MEKCAGQSAEALGDIAAKADEPAIRPNDNVVLDSNVHGSACRNQSPGHGQISRRCDELTARMVVRYDYAHRSNAQGGPQNCPGTGVATIDIAPADFHGCPDEPGMHIERQAPEVLLGVRGEWSEDSRSLFGRADYGPDRARRGQKAAV